MIIVPTYNERQNIRPLLVRIRAALPVEPVLFVDDSSPDGTADEIRFAMQSDPHIKLITRPEKGGLSRAYQAAFTEIIAQKLAPYVVTMDADLSHPPEKLPEIIKKLDEYPVVIGSRYTDGGRVENWNLRRRLLSRFGNYYAQVLTGIPASDLTAGMVGYRINALESIDLNSIHSDGYTFQIELKYLLHQAHQFLYEVPITFTERREGHSKFTWLMILEGVWYPVKILLSRLW